MREKASLYLSIGGQEFWLVDAKRKNVTVMRRQGSSQTYNLGQFIPLPLFGQELAVSEIFE